MNTISPTACRKPDSNCSRPIFQVFVIILIGFAFAGPFPVFAENPEPGFTEEATRLVSIPESAIAIAASVDARPDVGRVAFVYQAGQAFRACMNDVCSPAVDNIARGMPVISPDGRYWAAVAQRGEKAHVMLGGKMSRGYDMIHALGFSPDSMKLAYIAFQDGEFFVYENQDKHDLYQAIDSRTGLLFSSDSKSLAYVAYTGEAWHVIKNKKPGPPFEEIKHVTFSPDSSKLAYAAKKDGLWHLVVHANDGEEIGRGYKAIMHVVFSPFSGQVAYIAATGKGSVMVRNDQESDVFQYIPGEPVFSPDGDRLAFAVAEERRGRIRMRMVVDGKPGPAYDRIGAYRFSPDGKHFAYMAEKDGKGRIVQNGEAHKAYDSVGMPVFDNTGENSAYMILQGRKWHMWKNGELGPPFDALQNPVFCPEGKRMAYLARRGPHYLVVEDGEILGEYQWAGNLGYSPLGHRVYTAARDGESFLVIDGEEGTERFFSFIQGIPPVFIEDNVLQGIALGDEGREFHLIRATMNR